MLYPLWSAKGGSGTTVISVTLAAELGRAHASGALLVDLGGDVPAVGGLADPATGVTDWLAQPEAGPAALERLEVPLGREPVHVVALGGGASWSPDRDVALRNLLEADARPVVVDVGTVRPGTDASIDRLRRLVADHGSSRLVTRGCYLALRRAAALGFRPSSVVLVREAGRSLDRHDIRAVLGVAVAAEVDVDPRVARAVDAGRAPGACPRTFVQAVRRLT